jgi:hypothetical protein
LPDDRTKNDSIQAASIRYNMTLTGPRPVRNPAPQRALTRCSGIGIADSLPAAAVLAKPANDEQLLDTVAALISKKKRNVVRPFLPSRLAEEG